MNFKKLGNLDKHTRYSIYIIIAFALVVITLTSVYHVSGDGCWHMQASKFISENKKFPLFEPIGRDEPFWSPPLYHLIAASVFAVFGDFAYALSKFISPIFGIASLAVSFAIARRLYGPKIGLYSVIFLASIPIFIDYSVLSYVEAALVFFVLMSVYFSIKGSAWICGIFFALASLTKYNGLFIFPVLAFIQFKKHGNKKMFYLQVGKILLLFCAIALPWFIRNWIYLGNPIWPFLNPLFGGYLAPSYEAAGVTTSFNIKNLIHPNAFIFTYLGFFGVPDGNYRAFDFINIPYLALVLVLWLAGTIIFILPMFFGVKKEKKPVLWIWLASYFALLLLYVVNASWSVSRIILPALPAVSIFWAKGFEKMARMKFYRALAAIIVFGFVVSLFIKFSYASASWDFYSKDFEWVRQNTEKKAIFIANGQCIPYNIRRTSVYAGNEAVEKADYIWMNQEFGLDGRSIYTENETDVLMKSNPEIIYSNPKTKTRIYRITR